MSCYFQRVSRLRTAVVKDAIELRAAIGRRGQRRRVAVLLMRGNCSPASREDNASFDRGTPRTIGSGLFFNFRHAILSDVNGHSSIS